jgi:hypothetical protein
MTTVGGTISRVPSLFPHARGESEIAKRKTEMIGWRAELTTIPA